MFLVSNLGWTRPSQAPGQSSLRMERNRQIQEPVPAYIDQLLLQVRVLHLPRSSSVKLWAHVEALQRHSERTTEELHGAEARTAVRVGSLQHHPPHLIPLLSDDVDVRRD